MCVGRVYIKEKGLAQNWSQEGRVCSTGLGVNNPGATAKPGLTSTCIIEALLLLLMTKDLPALGLRILDETRTITL